MLCWDRQVRDGVIQRDLHLPYRTGYLPVMRAVLLGVHIGKDTWCVSFTPSLANWSMFGVGRVLLPKQPMSPIPTSSMMMKTTFGGRLLAVLADEVCPSPIYARRRRATMTRYLRTVGSMLKEDGFGTLLILHTKFTKQRRVKQKTRIEREKSGQGLQRCSGRGSVGVTWL